MIPIQKMFLSIILMSLSFQLSAGTMKSLAVESPDKKTKAEFTVDQQGILEYNIVCSGKKAILWSTLGLKTNAGVLGENTSIKGSKVIQVNEKFPWTLGENDMITNNYKELTISCVSAGKPFDVVVRVFNGAVAFRYQVSTALMESGNLIFGEQTSFHLPKSAIIYQYNQESVFTPTLLDTLHNTSDFPTTLRTADLFYSIGEAENNWFTKAELKKEIDSNCLTVVYPRDKELKADNMYATPWRTVAISKTATGLHDFADLYLKLNTTAVKEVPAWIKPGKLIRSQLNTQSGMDCIDFAVKHNLQYIMFDAGWYGQEFRTLSDPTQVIEQMDLPKIITYGKEKGIGVILYVNKVGLYQKLDTILPLYKKWGVAGFKFGFVDGLTQYGISWLNQAIKKVNDYGFILDIHDNYKPTGLSRKYPALLTQEGIRGDENCPDAFHTTTLPFTRFLAGPADFTFCYPNSRESFSKNIKVSKAHQLALSVIYFSPLQSLYWYGKPLDYKNDEEIEFFDQIPTVWNESHYLTGEIGDNISVARRKGDTWFMASAAGLKDWKGSIKLDFLTSGVKYEATIYEDNGDGGIRKSSLRVKKGDSFSLNIKNKGGQAIIIRIVK